MLLQYLSSLGWGYVDAYFGLGHSVKHHSFHLSLVATLSVEEETRVVLGLLTCCILGDSIWLDEVCLRIDLLNQTVLSVAERIIPAALPEHAWGVGWGREHAIVVLDHATA